MVEEYINEKGNTELTSGEIGYDPEQAEDQMEEQVEDQIEVQQDYASGGTPSPRDKDDLYSLFKWVIARQDSSKTGNVDAKELGMLDISVRDCQKIALLADTLGHPGFATFFRDQGEIILSTSASKKGWLAELFVSMKNLRQKVKGFGNIDNLPQQQKKKRKLF